MSSQEMLLKSASDGNCMSVSWFVGVLVLCGSSSVVCACCVAPAGAGGGAAAGVAGAAAVLVPCMSCLTSSGVFGSVCTGMVGHVVAKHRGCHDSPQLCMLRTRHSRPAKSWLQTGHVALVCGTRRGCMVVYVRVGRTIVLRRLLVVFLAASVVPSCIRLSRIRTVFASTPLPANRDSPFLPAAARTSFNGCLLTRLEYDPEGKGFDAMPSTLSAPQEATTTAATSGTPSAGTT